MASIPVKEVMKDLSEHSLTKFLFFFYLVAKPVHSSVIVMPNEYVGFDICLKVLHHFSFVKL